MRRDLKNEIYELDSIMESNFRLLKADQAVTAENKQYILDFIDDSKSRGLRKSYGRLRISYAIIWMLPSISFIVAYLPFHNYSNSKVIKIERFK